ncbi:transposase [Streptomyces sp. NPDC007905]|uniref:transposase n=1 Tax=Streptomyces sp. NPDC007905 TaxID=3364788 RepID=UPI0036EB2758
MLQELTEAAARIGAEWNEHTEARTAYRNGHRGKTLTTRAGDLDPTLGSHRPLGNRAHLAPGVGPHICPGRIARVPHRRSRHPPRPRRSARDGPRRPPGRPRPASRSLPPLPGRPARHLPTS